MPFQGSSDLLIRLDADPKGFQQGLKRAQASAREFERTLARKEAALARLHDTMQDAGIGIAIYGAATALALGLMAKAAIDWETAWAGVTKTVDGSPEQMAALEQELRELAKVLPATHTEIAAVAEAAGQLGIARQNIVAFTRTMVDLGVTTDLTAEEASMSIARFMNIMKSAPDSVDNLGAALVDLGNKGASTESEILEMSLRIAGAGKQIGLTEAQVMAFASTLASLGIRAEAGGSSISTIFIKMQEAVSEGGDTLERFAEIAGVTTSEFSQMWRTDAAGAIDLTVQGLARMSAQGEDLFAVLEDLGIQEIYQRNTMLAMAGAGDLLNKQLAIANEAWDENSALVEEAQKRYGTTASQLAIARNRITDFGITMGEHLLPVIGEVAAAVGGMADLFADLPGPVQGTIVTIAAVTAILGLFGGAALIAVPKVVEFRNAIESMNGPVARLAQRSLPLLGRALPFVGGALAAAGVILGFWTAKAVEAEISTDELKQTLDQATGAVTENTRVWVANKLIESGAFDQAKELGIAEATLVDAILGKSEALEEVNQKLAEAKGLTDETKDATDGYTNSGDTAGATATALSGVIADLSGQFGDAKDEIETVNAALGENDGAASDVTMSQQLLAESMGLSAEQAEEAAGALSELDRSLQQLYDTLFGVEEANAAVQESIDKVTESAEENGATLDNTTEAGRKNGDAVRGLISDYHDLISAEAEAGASQEQLAELTDDLREEFIRVMEAAGYTEEEIEDYIAAFDNIPEVVSTVLELEKKVSGSFGGNALGPMQFFQFGGLVSSGPSGIDQVPARLTRGEFVVREAQTRRHLPLLQAINAGASGPAMAAAMGQGGPSLHVEHLEVRSVGVDFRSRQVIDDLAYHMWMTSAS